MLSFDLLARPSTSPPLPSSNRRASPGMGCRIQAVAGLPLPKDVGLRVGASLMLNVLGDPDGTDMEKTKAELNRLADIAGAAPHWYGKAATRKGRKMGYIRSYPPFYIFFFLHLMLSS